jgi:hypothetical protein
LGGKTGGAAGRPESSHAPAMVGEACKRPFGFDFVEAAPQETAKSHGAFNDAF